MNRRILVTILTSLAVCAAPTWAAEDVDTQNSVVGGTIPELAQITISGDVSALLTLSQDGAGETSFDAGFVESATNAVILTLDANKKWQLSVKYSGTGWSGPAGYDKAETDLQIKITNTPTGTIQRFHLLQRHVDGRGDGGSYLRGFEQHRGHTT